MAKKTKIPAVRIFGDSYTVTVDDETYRPHAREWVDMVGRPSIDDLRMTLRAAQLQTGDPDDVDADTVIEMLENIIARVHARIAGWSWTNPSGDPYPNPPSLTDIANLEMSELAWLARGGTPTGDPKVSSGSIDSSKPKARRRRSGLSA